MQKKGRVEYNHVKLRKHELATISFLAKQSYDIELIPKIDIEGVHTPDMWMSGEAWEMKSPCGRGNSVIKNNLQTAVRQSNNVIIDLRRIKRAENKCLHELEKEFLHSKKLKRLMVITKGGKIIDYEK